jgi:hypothetical protein
MRALRFVNLAILSVLVGSTALVYAQEEKPQEEKPRQEETKPANQDTRGEKQDQKPGQEQSAKPQGQEHPAMQNDKTKPANQDTHGQKQDQRTEEPSARPQGQEHPAMQNDKTKPVNQDTRGEKQDQQRGQEQPQMQNNRNQQMHSDNGRKGGHIPDDRFRAQFGREHHFNARSVIVQGRPQFQYGGYNFELVDAWPSDWAYTDDCYVDYIDGQYYLIDLVHPGIRLAVFVVM